ncbi:MAG: B12-binding domain-containing radical SAM protein [Deltaproteobacteria bacterium]|nr:B12-binding domain-containing radical SAM protein [Deltaproteobacteria bacterium]
MLVRTSPIGAAFREPSPPAVTAPLGILYLAAALKEALGDAVTVEIESLSTAVRSPGEIPAFIADREPDVVGISSSLVEEPDAIAVARAARALAREPLVVLGGPYPSCSPARALERTGAHLAVIGEGERAFVEIVRSRIGGGDVPSLPGVASLEESGEMVTGGPAEYAPDPDAIAFPAWDLIPIETYSRMYNFNDIPLVRDLHVPLLTSRGCPYKCSFCHNIFGKKFRGRSPENVVDEMELLVERFGVREFHVVDDIFNASARRMEDICRLVVDRKLDVSLAFPNGVRGDIMTKEQIELLARAGCYSITFALESASPRILKRMNKRTNLEKLSRSVRLASEAGMITSCFIIFGYPGETREDLEATIRWVRDSRVDFPRHSIASPFPGTDMADHARGAGLEAEIEVDRSNYDWSNMGLASMPHEEFRSLVRSGMREIMQEPRRLARLKDIWSRWDEGGMKYMGHSPDRRF